MRFSNIAAVMLVLGSPAWSLAISSGLEARQSSDKISTSVPDGLFTTTLTTLVPISTIFASTNEETSPTPNSFITSVVTSLVPMTTIDRTISGENSGTGTSDLVPLASSGSSTNVVPESSSFPARTSLLGSSTGIASSTLTAISSGIVTVSKTTPFNSIGSQLTGLGTVEASSITSSQMLVTGLGGSKVQTLEPVATSSATNPEPADSSLMASANPTIVTLPDGQVTTLPPSVSGKTNPSPSVITNSNGQLTTVVPSADGESTAIGLAPSTTELPPSLTVSGFDAYIYPITTSVSGPGPTEDGFVIPCTIWFFNLCIGFNDDFDIFGWGVHLPPGTYPPGPPPTIKPNPSSPVEIEVTGTLPEWPSFTIGPDDLPTFPPEPSVCETESSAELCITSISYGVSVTGSITSTTATQSLSTCGAVLGCDIDDVGTATTTATIETATVDSSEVAVYAVFPEDGTNATQVGLIEAQLNLLINETTQQPFNTSEYGELGVLFWRVLLPFDTALKLIDYENVLSVLEECGTDTNPCYDPTTSLVYQEDSKPQLTYISWPNTVPATPFNVLDNRYYFDESAGEDVNVWVIDSGVTENHPEFAHLDGKLTWVTPLPDGDGVYRQDDSMTFLTNNEDNKDKAKAHGTAMLSLIAGATLGAAKEISPTIVRLPRLRSTLQGGWTQTQYLETCAQAAIQMEAQSFQASGIVSMAQYYPLDTFAFTRPTGDRYRDSSGKTIYASAGFEKQLYNIIRLMQTKNYLVVTGIGNDFTNVVNGWPASYGKPDYQYYLENLLVLGVIQPGQPSGTLAIRGSVDVSSGLPFLNGPGLDIVVAQGDTSQWIASAGAVDFAVPPPDPASLSWLPDASLYLSNPVSWISDTGGLYRKSQGSSDACSLTAGLAAYYLKLIQIGQLKNLDGSVVTNSVTNLKNYITETAWSRGNFGNGGQPPSPKLGIWNGADLSQPACKWVPPTDNMQRRQTGASCLIPLPSSTSVAPTSTAAPTTSIAPTSTQSITPLTTGTLTCNNEADYPGHADIHQASVEGAAEYFCASYEGDYTVDNTYDHSQIQYDQYDVRFRLTLQWIDGCVTTVNQMSPAQPVPGIKCADVFETAWKQCINGGVGGALNAGCLKYEIDAGI